MYDQSEVKNFAENNRWLELILYVEKCFGNFSFLKEKEQDYFKFKNKNYYEVHKFLIERQIKEYHRTNMIEYKVGKGKYQNKISYIDFDKMIFNNEEVLLKDLSEEHKRVFLYEFVYYQFLFKNNILDKNNRLESIE